MTKTEKRKKLFKKWIKALESGRYKQTTSRLYRQFKIKNKVTEKTRLIDGFCCLGVLCKAARLKTEEGRWNEILGSEKIKELSTAMRLTPNEEIQTCRSFRFHSNPKYSDIHYSSSAKYDLPREFAEYLDITTCGVINKKYRKKIKDFLVENGYSDITSLPDDLTLLNDAYKIPFKLIAQILRKFPNCLKSYDE